MDKWRIIFWILGIISFIFNILTAIFTIWTHVSLQILFYISFFALYIFILLIEISIYDKYMKNLKYKIEKHYCLTYLIFLLLMFYFYFILLINLEKYKYFILDCPFYLDKLDYDLNFDRRCEIYDINYNSRYSYQYICSYDSSIDFAKN